MKRRRIIAGNWKMYKTAGEAISYVKILIPKIQEATCSVYLAVPFTAINPVITASGTSSITIGAQNMNDSEEGAYTGEIAGRMLIDAGAQFVLLGHSERRHIYAEDNAFINKKVKQALANGLEPVLCVGETGKERKTGIGQQVVKEQIEQCLVGLTSDEGKKIILAYEPVWAIGNGQTATPDLVEKMHTFCRKCLSELFDSEVADQISILYGGSVKPNNAKELLEQNDIDGLLIGGASLSPDTFSEIVNISQKQVSV